MFKTPDGSSVLCRPGQPVPARDSGGSFNATPIAVTGAVASVFGIARLIFDGGGSSDEVTIATVPGRLEEAEGAAQDAPSGDGPDAVSIVPVAWSGAPLFAPAFTCECTVEWAKETFPGERAKKKRTITVNEAANTVTLNVVIAGKIKTAGKGSITPTIDVTYYFVAGDPAAASVAQTATITLPAINCGDSKDFVEEFSATLPAGFGAVPSKTVSYRLHMFAKATNCGGDPAMGHTDFTVSHTNTGGAKKNGEKVNAETGLYTSKEGQKKEEKKSLDSKKFGWDAQGNPVTP